MDYSLFWQPATCGYDKELFLVVSFPSYFKLINESKQHTCRLAYRVVREWLAVGNSPDFGLRTAAHHQTQITATARYRSPVVPTANIRIKPGKSQ